MADDKTTKTSEQPVTDTGPGKETPPAPPKEPEKVSVSPEPEKKTEPEVKNPQVSVYNFAEILQKNPRSDCWAWRRWLSSEYRLAGGLPAGIPRCGNCRWFLPAVCRSGFRCVPSSPRPGRCSNTGMPRPLSYSARHSPLPPGCRRPASQHSAHSTIHPGCLVNTFRNCP